MNRRHFIALEYAKRGWKIFPQNRNKQPCIKGWPDKATDDPEQIKAWAKEFPNANFAVVCGRSGIALMDADVKNGQLGEASLNKMVAEHGAFGTFVVRTQSGGFHVYFEANGEKISNHSEIDGFPGIEIKGDRGCATLPGSIGAGGGEYTVAKDVPLKPFPSWLFKLLKKAERQPAQPVAAGVITKGGRNQSLTSLAGSMRRRGMGQDAIAAALLVENKKCNPPLPDADVCAIAASISRYEPSAPAKATAAPSDGEHLLTDIGNAERFFSAYGERVRYCTANKAWLYWTGKVWKEDDNQVVSAWSKKTAKEMYNAAWESQDKELSKWALRSQNRARIEAMLALAKSEETIPVMPDELDTNDWAWNCANGTVDLRAIADPKKHDPKDHITKLSDTPFGNDSECPRWEQFLLEIMSGDADMVSFLQRVVGYCMTGDMREQVYFVLWGNGRNGKTVFMETLMKLFGDYGATALTDTFLRRKGENVQHDIARLRGARLVCVSETGERDQLDEQLVKQWVGQDTLSGRILYQKKAFDFKPNGKLVIRTNHKPVVSGQDAGIWRKSLLIKFAEAFDGKRQDMDLDKKLEAELPGILMWALRGCFEWQSGGLLPPEKVSAAVQEYKDDMDELADFFDEYLVLDPAASIENAQLYELYLEWCDKANEKKPIERRWFGRKMTDRGFEGDKIGGKRVRRGIGEK
jgi:putative DNA primase/helicase